MYCIETVNRQCSKLRTLSDLSSINFPRKVLCSCKILVLWPVLLHYVDLVNRQFVRTVLSLEERNFLVNVLILKASGSFFRLKNATDLLLSLEMYSCTVGMGQTDSVLLFREPLPALDTVLILLVNSAPYQYRATILLILFDHHKASNNTR